jgi:pyridoxine 4-dehydrogenase
LPAVDLSCSQYRVRLLPPSYAAYDGSEVPLGGFTPLQSETLSSVAARLNAKPMSVVLAWLLQRSPNILLIPGTSSLEHLRENVAGAGLQLPDDALQELNYIAG